ncbi:uncharacterized protein LOC131648989 [Vicia villosa]|uniref:uncharacterized protein LOC131648989 n=1 Tax=Vicia villosa TaxID=3911 RepID=UPI00273B5B07|nr:uncharacterized protein LOC131648989 [Vicia villosa]
MTQTYPHLAFVYFNSGYPMSFQFRFSHDTLFAKLISSLNSLLQYPENRKVVKLEYRSPSLDDEGDVQFTPFDVKNDEDLAVIWITFDRFSSKGPIELDAKLQRSGADVIKMLTHPKLPVFNNM